ncbi:hypothetical protein BS47DRAFT_1294739 [Hydnum rufescens UP504]|uniref:Up-regulated during septation protein 1 domain-containing protein n=1 Tax=Hydnum rufescens UP504 TaxID=1448309 RepID=A0A9P6DUZ2_9AGAM|nr:hypothetical protein BS47DRAFT_1294739 [Hydnum rufescens UP504]
MLTTPGASSSTSSSTQIASSPPPIRARRSRRSSPTASARSSIGTTLRSLSERSPTPPLPKHGTTRSPPGSRPASRPAPLKKNHVAPSSPSKSPRGVWKNGSDPINTRDELLMMLLTSQAVLDSREFEILSAEEVDELKKEHALLQKRISTLSKRITVESKIRDATSSLSKLSDPPDKRGSAKPAVTDQFETAQGKVDAAQRELLKASERAADVHRRLLEHRAAVLSFTVRNVDQPPLAEGTDGSDNGTSATTISGDLSPVSTAATSISMSSRTKFEGPHFYAGHSDAIIPGPSRPPPTWKEFSALQEKLVAANEAAVSAKRKAAEYLREVSVLNLEKSGIETQASLDVQMSEETAASLESELTRMKELERQLQETLRKKDAELDNSRGMVSSAELEARDSEIRQLKARWEGEVASLNAQLSDAQSSKNVSEELEAGRASLLELSRSLNATVPTGTTTLPILADVLATHVSLMRDKLEANEKSAVAWEVEKKQLEAEITRGLEARERILKEIDDARHDGEELRSKNQTLEIQLRERPPVTIIPSNLSPDDIRAEHERLLTLLLRLWGSLPSAEARAKVGIKSNPNPKSPKSARPVPPRTSSLSDMDVRALKSLYDTPTPSYPATSVAEEFTVDAFIERVQALLSDDRALVERLIRFAQSHDLLKSNAERAQRLAQESSVGLETYQKQVRTLEERNSALSIRQAALLDDIHQLEEGLELSMQQKQELEVQAAEQAQTLEELQDANNHLSARALTLAAEAAEAASTPSAMKAELEAKIRTLQDSLDEARDELDRIRSAESAQRIQLLDELNSMQTENGALRNQLRVEQRKNVK